MGSALTRRIIGIDPGLSGAVAVIDVVENGHARVRPSYRVWDTPTVEVLKGKKKRREYDIPTMHQLLMSALLEPNPSDQMCAVIEQCSPRPGEGVVSSFRLAAGFWIWWTLLTVSQVPRWQVHPAVWKRKQGLIGGDKNLSRMVAQQRFPLADLARVKDHGRAEALLIADYGRQQNW